MATFGSPYFRISKGEGLPPTELSAQMEAWGYHNISFVKHQPFSTAEEDRIRKGVQVVGGGIDQEIDWTLIWQSQSFQSTRTVDDLKRHWDHFLRPDVTRTRWTKEENRKLVQLVRSYGKCQGVQWLQVTSDFNSVMGSNRTVFDCFKRYQSRYSNHRIMHWNQEDNEKIPKLIADYHMTKKELFPWRFIRSFFPGRSLSAIYSHFNYHYSPSQLKGVKFTKSEDRMLMQAMNLGLQDKQLEILFHFQRSSNQIRNRMKHLKTVSVAGASLMVTKTKNDQVGLDLIKLIKNAEGQDADKESIEQMANLAKRHSNRKRYGRPRKSKLPMEEELRAMIRPLIFITNKRPRKNCFPGDAREHGLVLGGLYRFLKCNFDSDLVPAKDRRTPEVLLKIGFEKADHGTLTNLFDLIPLIPNEQQDLAYSSFSFEERKRRFLPPTLPTFAGTRGLLLYTPALEMQVAGEATIFDESGQVEEAAPCIPEGEVCLGDAHANELLLYRLMTLFYWTEKALQQDPRISSDATSVAVEPEVDVGPPPKKKSRRSYKKN